MPVGLAHDYLLVSRGAERTFARIAALWPDAPIYTLLYDEAGMASAFAGRTVNTSLLQRLGVRQRRFRALLPLFPLAAERLPIGRHRLVVSSSSAFAHGIRPPEGTVHISYCHTPFRYVWHERARAVSEFPRACRGLAPSLLEGMSRWDVRASRRVDGFIANAELTRRRIQEFWGRDAAVVHPPVETARFQIGEPEDFFLIATEIVPHKRVDLALEAAQRAGRPIKVVGEGPCLEELQARYPGAEFCGRVGDRELESLLARARAYVVPSIEEFGIAAVEAGAAGRPVLGPDVGGTAETVVDGRTGVLFPPGDLDALTEAMRYVDFERFDPQVVRSNALRFSPEAFGRRLTTEITRILRELGRTDVEAVVPAPTVGQGV